MLAGSFRMLNPRLKTAKGIPELRNGFAALTSDGGDENDETDEEQTKFSLRGLYNGGRCGCRHTEDGKSNHAICSLHESQRTSLPSWRRGLRDNRMRQMAPMAHPKPKSANQQGLSEDVSVLEFPEFTVVEGRKKRSRFEKMPKIASQDARRVPERKLKAAPAAEAATAALAAAAAAMEESLFLEERRLPCSVPRDGTREGPDFNGQTGPEKAADDTKVRSKLRHMLKVFSEKRQGGALMPISSTEWEYVEAVLDSGATVTVIPAHVGQGYDIVPSAASKAGVMYEIANGEEIPNLGEKLMAVVTDDGAWRGLQAQVADVSKMLQSVRSLVKAGHTVVFGDGDDGHSHYVYHKLSGECIGVRDDGVNYLMGMHIVPKDEAGFARPAH